MTRLRWGRRTPGRVVLVEQSSTSHHHLPSLPPLQLSEIPGLLSMTRPNTIPTSVGLVGIGAYGARNAASGFETGTCVRLTLSAILTVLVTTASMLINDYYDFRDGIDNASTKPGRPLVTGQVRPQTVKLVLKWLYALHLTLLCCVDSMVLRLSILANTLLTYFYSVHLKPRTGIKNAACATVVSMAVGVGAIARCGNGNGKALAALNSVWRSMATVGGLIWHREIVMDIKDIDADESVGIRTVPVVYGKRAALWMSLVPLTGAMAAAASIPPFLGTRSIMAAMPLVVQGLVSVWSGARGFDLFSLKVSIEFAPLWLALSLLALSTGKG